MIKTEIKEKLKQDLDKSIVKSRKQGSQDLKYLEGHDVISIANDIFGYDGWGYTISELKCVSEREIKKEDERGTKNGWEIGYICKLKLEIYNTEVVVGEMNTITIREDVGFGSGIDYNSRAAAHESAGKEAVTDALKRTFRTFGNRFGNCLYSKTYRNEELGNGGSNSCNNTNQSQTNLATSAQIGFINKLLKDKNIQLSAYTTKPINTLTKTEAGEVITKLQSKE